MIREVEDQWSKRSQMTVEIEANGAIEMPGDLALPEAVEILGLGESGDDDTIGGHVVALLKRLPESGDELRLGAYLATVTEVSNRRIETLRFEPAPDEDETD